MTTEYEAGFEAGEKAQAEKDRAEIEELKIIVKDKQYAIEKCQQFWSETNHQLEDSRKALDEAKKQGEIKLLKELIDDKKLYMEPVLVYSYLQAKLKSLEER